ncbi:neutral zinc metallopeptidase [Streptosporangium sp. NBC_01810]|uniref:neutral zinc metallopeptidase n=1 Tax=Streptosporangium sp. NBC_01810 TaxID=2975951 RepID=UPI002DDB5CEC|nr:neutral zinc metallopeptidase [Streptosporangium sp. NBC_01810]WSA27505.1 neutral zinc metallopeptidase [Streptosporangium sp. NBC_01810]
MNPLPFRRQLSLVVAFLVFAVVVAGIVIAVPHLTPAALPAPAPAPTSPPTPAPERVPVIKERAAPRGRTAATASRLYHTGSMRAARCSTGTIRTGSAASYRTFMTQITRCLNLSWKTQFSRAGLPFAKPRLRFSTSKVTTPCGRWPGSAGGLYCSTNKTIYIGITRQVLRNPYAANHAQFMAHEYGHHVQHLAGIMDYYARSVWLAKAPAKLAYSRRLELQADCLASVFLRQIADDLPVERAQWEAMVGWVNANGHKNWPKNDHGKGRSQAYWMERGFDSGSPSGCNTWSAPTGRVA